MHLIPDNHAAADASAVSKFSVYTSTDGYRHKSCNELPDSTDEGAIKTAAREGWKRLINPSSIATRFLK